jgi:hypothetical protein
MFINVNSIIINSINISQYITEAKFGYHKLWADDSGRNLSGDWLGTLIGIYPKITLQFKRLSKVDIETIASILDSATQSLTYYDPKKKASTTLTTYTGDWELVNRSINVNEGFSCSFISTRKRA